MAGQNSNYSYSFYKKEILDNLKKIPNLNIISYSPYSEYSNLETILIYNQNLLKSEHAVIHISGTHGIEGIAGAEVQLEIIQKLGVEIAQSKIGVLFIFALNPYGFHFLRRTSLENIDLNRNCGSGISGPPRTQLQKWLEPLLRSQSQAQIIKGYLKALVALAICGYNKIFRTLAEGQDFAPQGLFYTGSEMAVEVKALFFHIFDFIKNKTSISIIDVHSGLGKPFEELLIQCGGQLGQANKIFQSAVQIPGVTPNTYRGNGLLADRFQLLCPKAKILFTAQEFGTKSTTASFFQLTQESTFHFSNIQKVESQKQESLLEYFNSKVKNKFLNTFFYSDADWLKWIKQKGLHRFQQQLSSLEDFKM
jgi:hypothetical protein